MRYLRKSWEAALQEVGFRQDQAQVCSRGGRFQKLVAADLAHALTQLTRAGRLKSAVFPIDHLALTMQSYDNAGGYSARIPGKGDRLRRAERSVSDIVTRGGTVIALREFYGFCLLPACRILQIQVDSVNICLPALWKGDMRKSQRNTLCQLEKAAACKLALCKVNTVGIYERNKIKPAAGEYLFCRNAEQLTVRNVSMAKLLNKAHHNLCADPFVGVMGGAYQNAVFPRAERGG